MTPPVRPAGKLFKDKLKRKFNVGGGRTVCVCYPLMRAIKLARWSVPAPIHAGLILKPSRVAAIHTPCGDIELRVCDR